MSYSHKSQKALDFFLASKRMHWIPVGASVFATNIGSGNFIGKVVLKTKLDFQTFMTTIDHETQSDRILWFMFRCQQKSEKNIT